MVNLKQIGLKFSKWLKPDYKFRVRIQYFGNTLYCIQYAYYKRICTWNTILYWSGQHITSSLSGWHTYLFSIENVENFASHFKTIEDINNFYKPYQEEERKFIKRREDYYKKQVPYNSKEI